MEKSNELDILTNLSLFSGVGGLDIAAKWTGRIRTVCYVEKDEYAQAVIQSRIRDSGLDDAPIWDDVTMFDGRPWRGRVDCVSGGFPCQDVSFAGKRAGLKPGTRSGLWNHFARIIREVRPRFVLVENVAGLLSLGLGNVLGDLAKMGMDAKWGMWGAADVGAPHLRKRVWIIAYAQRNFLRQQPGRSGWQSRKDQAQSGTDGEKESLAYSKGQRCGEKGPVRLRESKEWSSSGSKEMADTKGKRRRVGDSENERKAYKQGDASGDRRKILGNSTGEGRRPSRNSRSGEEPVRRTSTGTERSGWWSVEPDVGGTLNGMASWLDGIDVNEPHKLLLAYGETKEGSEKVLSCLQKEVRSKAIQEEKQAREPIHVSPTKILLTFLRRLQTWPTDQTRIQLESAKASQGQMRSLRIHRCENSTSCGSKSGKQRTPKHPNSLQALSRLLALYAEKAWSLYSRANAPSIGSWGDDWETGIARVSAGVPHRVDRLRCCGNGVVPQQALPAWEEIIRRADMA